MASSLSDRQLNRAYISMRDMDQCVESLECAATALERQDYKPTRGLLTAAIICYGWKFDSDPCFRFPKVDADPCFR